MDTKWKNNKWLTFPAIAVAVAAAVLFMALFPFFNRKAKETYSDPLTEPEFIQNLLSANFIQYKYLKEKTDQQQYDYELYYKVDVEGEGLAPEEISTLRFQDEFANEQLQSALQDYSYSLSAALGECESTLSALGDIMDYYVEDLDSGTVLANNSSAALPEAVDGSHQQASSPDTASAETTSGTASPAAAADDSDSSGAADTDYIYYVSMEYDAAGNITNVAVRSLDNAKQFLNRVQSAGHDIPANLGISAYESYRILDSFDNYYSTVNFTLEKPRNMRVIYGLTQSQYSALLNSGDYSYLYDSSPLDPLAMAGKQSYFDAGIVPAYLLWLAACILCGILIYRKEKDTPAIAPPDESRSANASPAKSRTTVLPPDIFKKVFIEIPALIILILTGFSSTLVRFVYEYENDLFLRNIRAGIGNNGRILFLSLDKTAMFLLLTAIFLLAFLAGRCFSGVKRSNLKYRSFFCKYWNKIWEGTKDACRKFYTDLVSYDIGTDANRIILKVLGVNFIILTVICCFWFAGIFGILVYSVIAYFILKKYVMDIQAKYSKLLNATRSIAQGNLDTALSEDFGIFESYKSQLRQIQLDFKRAVDEEVKSQRMKSELITNVSHDLKTPLTAIITYIELLKGPEVTEEKQREYLDILQKKANRLKVLIEDLFEISKASSRTVTLQIMDVDINNLIRQAYLEQEDRILAARLDFKFNLPEKHFVLPLDSQKTYRIFDNLYANIIKYALPGTRVYINMKEKGEFVQVELKNISASELDMDPTELTERFVRGDGSRNTEGSGLGLAIVKSFAELQGGSMRIELDGDLFKVILCFRQKQDPEKPDGESVETSGNMEGTVGNTPEGMRPVPPDSRRQEYFSGNFPGSPSGYNSYNGYGRGDNIREGYSYQPNGYQNNGYTDPAYGPYMPSGTMPQDRKQKRRRAENSGQQPPENTETASGKKGFWRRGK